MGGDGMSDRMGLQSPDGRGGLEIKGADTLLVRGLLQELPPVGSVWPQERREAWVAAMLAAFAVMYERAP
jgi:hypothetical protein